MVLVLHTDGARLHAKFCKISPTYTSRHFGRDIIQRHKSNLKQESYAQRAQTSADPGDPDFGLWTPGSEA